MISYVKASCFAHWKFFPLWKMKRSLFSTRVKIRYKVNLCGHSELRFRPTRGFTSGKYNFIQTYFWFKSNFTRTHTSIHKHIWWKLHTFNYSIFVDNLINRKQAQAKTFITLQTVDLDQMWKLYIYVIIKNIILIKLLIYMWKLSRKWLYLHNYQGILFHYNINNYINNFMILFIWTKSLFFISCSQTDCTEINKWVCEQS